MSPIKTSELTSDSSLNASTDYIVFVDVLDTTQAATGTTKKTPVSAMDSYTWSNSANYGLHLISPLNTLVNTNSANWNTAFNQSNILASASANNASVYSNTNTNSANNASNYSRVNSTSANWSSVYSNVNSTSANWNTAFVQSNILASSSANNASNYSRVNSTSANWSSVYSNVNSTSANWNTAFVQSNILASSSANNASNYSRVNSTSANWSSVYSNTNTNSANWQSNYSTVRANSATWGLGGGGSTDMTGVWSNSANWQSNYSTVRANSASWGGGSSSPTTLTFASDIIPDCNEGLYRKITMTGNCSLSAPINGIEGTKWKGKFLASGANCDLIFDTAIKIPSETTFLGTKTISAGFTYITQLEYSGTDWWLQTLIGGWS